MITSVGIIDICSKLELIKPIKNPNKAKVKATNKSKKIINNGYLTSTSTKKVAVIKITTPIKNPNKAKVKETKTNKNIISIGYFTVTSAKNEAVI